MIAGREEGLEITIFDNGSLIKMTKPDFKQMNRKELKKYILSHPTDDEAIHELFVNRRNPNAKIYPYPYDMSYEEVEAIFKSKLNQDPT